MLTSTVGKKPMKRKPRPFPELTPSQSRLPKINAGATGSLSNLETRHGGSNNAESKVLGYERLLNASRTWIGNITKFAHQTYQNVLEYPQQCRDAINLYRATEKPKAIKTKSQSRLKADIRATLSLLIWTSAFWTTSFPTVAMWMMFSLVLCWLPPVVYNRLYILRETSKGVDGRQGTWIYYVVAMIFLLSLKAFEIIENEDPMRDVPPGYVVIG